MPQPKSTANAPHGEKAETGAIILDLERYTLTAQDLNLIPIRITPVPVSPDLAAKHLGIIAKHVYTWYRYIPMNVQAFYDTEDMIADVALHVHSIMLRYQPEKAREVTWVYKVAHNSCRDIVQHYQRKVRTAVNVEIGETGVAEISQESFLRKREAIGAVERVIACSSEAAQDLIACLLSGDFHRQMDLPKHAHRAIKELRKTARSQNATADDFLVVFRHATT